ncbi:MAG TPA: NAD(P)-binding domain-containing protein [Candidatus Limnocylindrales bacterium]|nr:NAD(P)-binding domain-containing protein [Candidatus Limnocylindrales bacterium]
MRIAVIGAGKVGGTIGGRWAAAGHEVVYGLRDPAKKEGAHSIAEALKAGDVVLLAIPGAAVAAFVREHAKALDGKVIIDATNNFGGPSMHCWPEMSVAAPQAKLYRAFNSYGWDVFANPVVGGVQADLFYAGTDGPSQATVELLISDAGLRPVWVGGADHADTVDGVLRLWFTLARSRGRRIAFRLLTD